MHALLYSSGDEQDGRCSGVAAADSVRLIVCPEVSRRRQQLVRSPDSRDLTGRRDENKGGDGGFADFVVEVVISRSPRSEVAAHGADRRLPWIDPHGADRRL